jgi:hypothetical protein
VTGPPPPEDPPDDRDHGDREHHHEFEMLCLTTAVGWLARFEKQNLLLIAWVLVEETCPAAKGRSAQFIEGLCLLPGSTEGPIPATWLADEDKEDDIKYGKFIGYFPADD